MPERLHIHWSGRADADAPTLVLLHGITNSGACWPDAVSRWAGTFASRRSTRSATDCLTGSATTS